MKKILAFLLCFMLVFSLISCGGGSSDNPSGSTSEKPNQSESESQSESQSSSEDPKEEGVIDLSGQTNFAETVTTAQSYANKVQAFYEDNERTSYSVENQGVSLQHALTGKKLVTSLRNDEGAEYLFNTLDSYVVFNGETYYGSDGASDARINTTKLGYYYYSTYVRDMNFESFIPLHLEKAYHVYSDRVRQQFRIIAEDKSDYVTEFGHEIKVTRSRVEKFEISDGTGTITSLENGTYVYDNPDYIALDIKNAGVCGIVTAGQNTKVKVVVNAKYYVIRQYVALNGVKAADEATFANGLYTDKTHDFKGIRKSAEEEKSPLTAEDITVEAKDGAAFAGYNKLTGAYNFAINGHGFNEAYFKQPQKKYFESIKLNGKDDRVIYIAVQTAYPLEGATLVDKDEKLLPVPLQVGKNFGHEKEEPIYNPLDTIYGETIMPLSVKSGTEYEFTVVNAYQKWGNYDLKQLSSIEYFISYYHLSTGVSETNCIAPYYSAFASGPVGYAWILPDFRGCSEDLWADTEKQTGDPQYNSVGTLYGPTDNYGLSMGNYMSSDIASSGLTYADLDYTYLSEDGNYVYTMRHVEMPQKDESRTYYTIDFTFLKDTVIDNEKFSIIGFDGRKGTYSNAAYLDENGTHRVIENPTQKGTASVYKLNKNGSYFAYYGLPASLKEETGNFGCIVKDYSITINGKKSDVGLAFLNDFRTNKHFGNLNYGSLTLDSSVSFKKGDTISVDLILLPCGKIGQTDFSNVINVYNDSVKNAIKAEASVGEVGSDTWIPTVIAENNACEFTLTGGVSEGTPNVIYTVKVQGFTKLAVPKIYEKVNGEWQDYSFSTELGYDGYGVSCENGKLTYSFVFTQSENGRTFKVVAE